MKRISILYLTIFFLSIAAFFVSCSKSGSNPTPKNTGPGVTISSLSVNAGPYTTQVIITGTGFSSTANDDKIYFDGKAADVTLASSTQLTTSVPLAASTGPVTVIINGITATGPTFTYQKAQVVSDFVVEGQVDGSGTAKSSFQPNGIAVDGSGNVYVADKANLIRKITPDGVVSTIAGNGTLGTSDGAGTAATFSQPSAIAVDATGNIFVSDFSGMLIRKITPGGVVSTIAGNKIPTGADGTGTAASFGNVTGIVFDNSGNLLVSDQGFSKIRKITSAGVVTTLYSNSQSFYGLAIDKAGNLFGVNSGANLIDEISVSGKLSLFAGGNFLPNNMDGTGANAQFNSPYAIAIDPNGNLFVIDSDNTIREITPGAVVTTLGGQHDFSYDGPVANATFTGMTGIAVDGVNNIIYVTGQNTIRKISIQ